MLRIPLRGLLPALLFLSPAALAASVTLSADAESPVPGDPAPAYTLIRQALGKSGFNTPDCTHPDFGPHIRQDVDSSLGRVFMFHLHVFPDGDMCMNTNHPRNEIKVDAQSSDYLKVFHNDSVNYRWTFRLPPGFQSSYNFTYIHQIKAADGDTLIPLIAFNVQKGKSGRPDRLLLNHADSAGVRTTLRSVDLPSLLGEWVEAHESITADTHGRYALTLTRLRDRAELLSYRNDDIDMWRFSGTTFIRPKWGFYRSVDNPQYLRDDYVSFKQFCMAKGEDDCPATQQMAAAPVFTPAPGTYAGAQSVTLASTTPGATIRYSSDDSTPDCGSGLTYGAPLDIASTTTLRAVACADGMGASTVALGSYRIGPAGLPEKLAVADSGVSASASADSNHGPTATVDANLGTSWAAQGDGQWIRYDLEAVRSLSQVRIAWYRGTQGKATFDLQVSSDGSSFATVYSGQSSGTTTAPESYGFPEVNARFVRILGHGNSVNTWNLIAETELWGR
ncbi:MAG: hypothetical protein K0Q68_513 [Moraxellaceae bacterium]|jgi:hypothetical protein|nr:hypothetical protein [Moraxellaceae bacterium]